MPSAKRATAKKVSAVVDPRLVTYEHGFRYQNRQFLIQTVDGGPEKRYYCTYLKLSEQLISSKRTRYPSDLAASKADLLRLMRRSHLSMCQRLRDGDFNLRIRRFLKQYGGDNVIPISRKEAGAKPALSPDPPDSVSKNKSPVLKEQSNMADIKKSLNTLHNEINGSLGAALVDHESGMALGTVGSGLNLEIAAAGNMEVVRAKMRVMKSLDIDGSIEDILITLEGQYHIIRPVGDTLFFYVALDRKNGNLAMARHKLTSVAKDLKL